MGLGPDGEDGWDPDFCAFESSSGGFRRRQWQPTPVFLPEEFQGQRSLTGYIPWGLKELDMTEHTHTSKVGFMVLTGKLKYRIEAD